MPVLDRATRAWHRFDIRRIEDLRNAVLGAELEAIQMPGPAVRGSLAFAAYDGVIFSSGLIDGRVAIRGALSRDALTLELCLRLGPGSRHWLNEVGDGDVGVVLPGDEHDAIYMPGSLYVAATLAPKRLEQEAVRKGLVFDRRLLGSTGLYPIPIPPGELKQLTHGFAELHEAGDTGEGGRAELGTALLHLVIAHYAQVQRGGNGRVDPEGRAQIVHRAREYIRENLAAPISIDKLAMVAGVSRRTLYRAFREVLGDTPQDFVRRLRLHRIRQDLISDAARVPTISALARSWGVGADLGRLSARYHQLFGENPSRTLAMHRHRLQGDAFL